MVQRFDRILWSDYNAIQNIVFNLLGDIQEGIGYGFSTASEQYPFDSNRITNVTRATNGLVTTQQPHYLVDGEIIYIDQVQGMVQLNGVYATVFNTGTSGVSNTFNININTSTYGVFSGTARMSQEIISANQFNKLRIDLNRCRLHQEGSDLTQAQVPTVVRNTPIQFSVYQPYSTITDSLNVKRFFLATTQRALYQPPDSPRVYTPSWQTALTLQIEVEWSRLIDIRAFFNTGGYVEFTSRATDLTTGAARSLSKNNNWATLLEDTPVNYGAYANVTMGNRPGKWADSGYYEADAIDRTIYQKNGTGLYSTNFFRIQHRLISDRRIRWSFRWQDTVSNSFAQNVTADISLQMILYYSTGAITLDVNPQDYIYSLGNITGS